VALGTPSRCPLASVKGASRRQRQALQRHAWWENRKQQAQTEPGEVLTLYKEKPVQIKGTFLTELGN